MLAVAALIIGLVFLFSGCRSVEPSPHITYTKEWVVFHGEPVNGIIGRTKDGKTLVTPGYIIWSENLAIQLESALAKLEQERIAKLKSTMGSAP